MVDNAYPTAWNKILRPPLVTVSVGPTSQTGASFGSDNGGQVAADAFLTSAGGGLALLVDGQALEIAPAAGNAFTTPAALGTGVVPPATSVTGPPSFGASAVVGISLNFARQDHVHGLPLAPTVPSPAATVQAATSYGASSVVGTSSNYAREDHSHGSVPHDDIGNLGGSGFTANQFAQWDGAKFIGGTGGTGPAPATTVQAGTSYGTGSGVGILTTYAREDHQHGTVSHDDVGNLAASGFASGNYAQWNGTNFVGGAGGSATPATTVTGPDAYGAAAVVGTSLLYARADHDHGLPSAPSGTVVGLNLTLVPSGDTTGVTDSSNVSTAIASSKDVRLARGPSTGTYYISGPIVLTPNIELYGPSTGRISAGGGDVATTNAVVLIKSGSSFSGASMVTTGAPSSGTAVNVWNIHMHDLIVEAPAGVIVYDLNNSDWCSYHDLYAHGGTIGFRFSYNNTSSAPSSTQVPGPRNCWNLYAEGQSSRSFYIQSQTQTTWRHLYANGQGTTPVAFDIEGLSICKFSDLLAQGYTTTGLNLAIFTFPDSTKSTDIDVSFTDVVLLGGAGTTGLNANSIAPTTPVHFNGLGVSTNGTPVANQGTKVTITDQY